MSPEERVRLLLVNWFGAPGGLDVLHADMLRQFAAAIREAVAEERRACARLCDNAGQSAYPTDLAAAIRARG